MYGRVSFSNRNAHSVHSEEAQGHKQAYSFLETAPAGEPDSLKPDMIIMRLHVYFPNKEKQDFKKVLRSR